MKICSPEGRDCIEKKSSWTFNCSVACEGTYADVQWEEKIIDEMEEESVEDEVEEKLNAVVTMSNDINDAVWKELMGLVYKNLKQEIGMVKGGWNGNELDRKKYMKLISEYRQFKKNEVRHFRFNSAAHATTFGKLQPILCK